MRVFGMFPVSSVRVARPVHPQRGIGEPASARPSLRGYGTIGSKAHWLGPALSSGTYAVPQDCEANRRRAVEPAGTLQHARARMNGLPSFPIVRSRSLEEGYLAERFALGRVAASLACGFSALRQRVRPAHGHPKPSGRSGHHASVAPIVQLGRNPWVSSAAHRATLLPTPNVPEKPPPSDEALRCLG